MVWSCGDERATSEATSATPPINTTRASNERSLGLKPAQGALVFGAGALLLGTATALGAAGLGALADGAGALAPGAALPGPPGVRAAFIMRTSLTRFAIVPSGRLEGGIAPRPFLIVAAICSSVTRSCHAGSERLVALSIGPRGPSPRPS